MNYKNILIIFFFLFSACSTYNVVNKDVKPLKINGFQNKGFALVYDKKLFKEEQHGGEIMLIKITQVSQCPDICA